MNSSKTAIVILAAGSSTRMGSPKQLLDFGGRPLIRHAVDTALTSLASQVIVVLGSRSNEITDALSDLPATAPVEIIENPQWEQGMGTSIQAGIHEALHLGCDGAILALADQPFITAEILNRLIAEHQSTGKPIVTSEYAGTVGVPVYFAASHFTQLLTLQPDQGCKGVILKNGSDALRISCPEAELDIDTPDDYRKMRAHLLVT